jgi:hypothetical protein
VKFGRALRFVRKCEDINAGTQWSRDAELLYPD